jgi:hypothetical protein
MRSLLVSASWKRHQRHNTLLRHSGLNLGAVLHIASQLAARRVNVIAPGFAHRGDQTRVLKLLGKSLHAGVG